MTTVASPPQPPPSTGPPPAPPAVEESRPRPAETGVWIAIATISMTFAALTSAMVVRGSAAPDWRHFRLPPVLYFNTAVLLASSAVLEAGRRRIAAHLVRVTLGLGALFVAGQVVAWRQLAAQGLFLATGPSSAFFYVFTALHGLHVLGGLVGLLYVLHRLRRTVGVAPTALGAAALYWHFMGVLWLYLLTILTIRV
jgi:cytochrome c oxidase subunit 3